MPKVFIAARHIRDSLSNAQSAPLTSRIRSASGPESVSLPRSIATVKAVCTLLVSLVLGACGSLSGGESPAPKEPARLEIAIEANRDLNLDLKGRGAPMLLRVYELKSDVAFQDADFFALQNTDKAVLGPDLLAVDQFVIRPGETREIRRKSNPETTAIGIFAGYRDLPNSVWRVVHKMPPAPNSSWYRAVIPSNQAKLKIDLQSNAILLTDEKAGKQPVRFANESMKGLGQDSTDVTKTAADVAPPGVGKAALEGVKKLAAPQ
jgi:type VI secretion system protein VasD